MRVRRALGPDLKRQRLAARAPGNVGANKRPGADKHHGANDPRKDRTTSGMRHGRLGYQGRIATWFRPVVSGNPNMRFIFWTAWPEAPFTRLS